ncbi:telomere-protecting terminal protein Tpg [Streptomyces sp. NPDC058145]|uniref:telomere-protecting terminal protein Tpg n=1 Tax=Streptomyces sp. NPDC058145 TaxID=3346356 RepID=UPI0036E58976
MRRPARRHLRRVAFPRPGESEFRQCLPRVLLLPLPPHHRTVLLLKAHRGSTRRVAAVLGVSQRTVQRWVTKKPGARRPPGPLQVKAIEEAVLARWQPRVRARLRAQAEAEGFVFHTRARFGFVAPAGSSDDPRVRWITQPLPGEVARELFAGGLLTVR